jgi:hypothetical protein
MSAPKVEPSTKKAFNFPKGPVAKSKKTPATTAAKNEAKAAVPAPGAVKKVAKKGVAKVSGDSPKSKGDKNKAGELAAQPAGNATTPAVTSEAAVTSSAIKTNRAKKEKVVRDSFTMPKSEYAKIALLKQKCLDNGLRVKKSELLRAALAMLDAAPDKRVVAAIKALEAVKTGRPASA